MTNAYCTRIKMHNLFRADQNSIQYCVGHIVQSCQLTVFFSIVTPDCGLTKNMWAAQY